MTAYIRDASGRRIRSPIALLPPPVSGRPVRLLNVQTRTAEDGVSIEALVNGVAPGCFAMCRSNFGKGTRIEPGVWTVVSPSVAVDLIFFQIDPAGRRSHRLLLTGVEGIVLPVFETTAIVGNAIIFREPYPVVEGPGYGIPVNYLRVRPTPLAAWEQRAMPSIVPDLDGWQMSYLSLIETPNGVLSLEGPIFTITAAATFTVTADPTLTFPAGPPIYVGAAFAFTAGTTNASLTEARIELAPNTDPTPAEITNAGPATAWTGSIQGSAADRYMRIKAFWELDGVSYTTVSPWSTIIDTPEPGLSPAEPALGVGAVTTPQRNWVPGDQEDTFKPEIEFPFFTSLQRSTVQFQAKRDLSEAVWQTGAVLSGIRFFVVSPSGVTPNPTLYSVGNPAQRSIYIRYRFSSTQEWSDPSIAYTLTPPGSGTVVVSPDPPHWRLVSSSGALLDALIAAPDGFNGEDTHIAVANASVIGEIVSANSGLNKVRTRQVVVRPAVRHNVPGAPAEPILRRLKLEPTNTAAGLARGVNRFTFDGLRFVGDRVAYPPYVLNGVEYPRIPYFGSNSRSGTPTPLSMAYGKGLVVRNCRFDFLAFAIDFSNAKTALIEWNEFTGIRNDVMRLYGAVSNITSRNNYIHSPLVVNGGGLEGADTDGNHPDIWQFSETGAIGVYIYDNLVEGGDHYTQFVYVNSEQVNRYEPDGAGGAWIIRPFPANGHKNFEILRNHFISSFTSAILIGGVDGMLIEGNLIERIIPVRRTTGNNTFPKIAVKGPNRLIRIRNNVWTRRGTAFQSDRYIEEQTAGRVSGMPSNLSNPRGDQAAAVVEYTGNQVVEYLDDSTDLRVGPRLLPSGWVDPKVGRYGYL